MRFSPFHSILYSISVDDNLIDKFDVVDPARFPAKKSGWNTLLLVFVLGLLCGNVDRYYKLYHQGMVVLPSSSATTQFHCPVCNITATCPPSDPLTSSTNHVNDDGGDKSTDPPVECPDIKLEIEQAKNQAIHRVTSTLLSQMTQKENDLKTQIGEKQRMIDGKTAGIFSAVDDLHQKLGQVEESLKHHQNENDKEGGECVCNCPTLECKEVVCDVLECPPPPSSSSSCPPCEMCDEVVECEVCQEFSHQAIPPLPPLLTTPISPPTMSCPNPSSSSSSLIDGGGGEEIGDVRGVVREEWERQRKEEMRFSEKNNFASSSQGADIVYMFSTPAYSPYLIPSQYHKIVFLPSVGQHQLAIQDRAYLEPKKAFLMEGSSGELTIDLGVEVIIEFVTISHIEIPSPELDECAPQHIQFHGLSSLEDEKGVMIGEGEFDISLRKNRMQKFQISSQNENSFPILKFKILSNHGKKDYTCIYKVGVFGQRK